MIEYIEQALSLLWGDYAFSSYDYIFFPLTDIILLVFGILIVVATFKLFKWFIFSWWRLW